MSIFTKKNDQYLFKTITVFILTLLAFPALAVDYYWVGGTGSWTSPSTHWATSSGGAVFHPSVPSQFDRVIFDANSFSASGQEVTMNSEGFCLEFRSKDVRSGVKFTSTKQLNVYNGFSIDSNLIYNQTGFLNILAGGFTIGKNTSFTVNGNITLTAGNFIIQRQTTFYQNGTFNITLGNFDLASKTTYTHYGDMNMNNGSFTMGDSITWTKNNSINQNRGDFRIGTDNNFVVNGGNILNDVNGDFYIGARTTFNLNCCTMRTAGHLYIDNSAIINTNSAMQIGIGNLVLDSGTRWTCSNQLYIVNGSLIVRAGARFTQSNNTIIYGSLDIDSAAIVAGSTQYYMRGTGAGLYVKSGNRDLRRMQFDGSNGQYTFMDDVTLSSDGLYMYGAGNSINFNGKKVNVYSFYQWDGNAFSMNLTGTDTIKVKREFRIYSSVTITGNPVIYFDGSDNFYFNSNNNKVFDKVYMKAQNTGGSQIQFQSISNIKSVEILAYGTQPLYFENVTIKNFNLNYLQNINTTVNAQFSNAAHIDTLNITSSFNIKTNLITNGNNYLGMVNIPNIIQWTIQSSNTQTLVSINPLTGACGAEILINSNNPGTAGTISMATDTLKGNWLKIQDCIGTGGAVYTADNTVNFGNVTGWLINSIPPRDFYWVGGTGNWNDASHWSLTSGGTPVGCALPNKSDNVFFDSLSFSASGQSVTINVTADVNNFTVGNIIQGARFTSGSELYVYGSLVLNRKMSYELNSNLNFVSADTTIKTIFTDSVKLRQVYFGRNTSSNNAKWMLLDNFNNNDNYLYMQYGKLITNGKNIRTFAFYAWDGGNKNIDWTGTDTVQVQYQFYANPNSFPWTSNPKVLIFESTNHFYLYGGNHTFNDIIFNARNTGGSYVEIQQHIIARDITVNAYGYQWMNLYHQFTARDFTFRYLNSNNSNQTLDFQTNNPSTFRSVKIYGSGLQRPNVYFRYNTTADTLIFNTLNDLYFQNGYTKTVKKYMSVQGACDNRFPFRYDGTNTVIMADTGAILNADWVNMTNIKVQGVGTFTGTNILNLGGNIGWNINAVPTTNFYWVGGTGNWDDKNHWALTSGGTPGACPIPSQTDNVFFDVNSFTAANQTVTINTTANCLSMSWNNVNFPRINGGNDLNIYGSMTLDSKLSWQHSGWTYFRSNSTGNTVSTKGILLTNIQYSGTGEWTLGDNLRASHVYVNSGSFISGGKSITLSGNFYCWTNNVTSVNLVGTDTITVGNEFRIYTNNFTLNMGNAVIKFAGTNNFYFNGGNKTYTDLVFNADNTGNSTIQLEHNNIIRNLKINAAGYQIINMVSSSTYNDVTMLFRNPSNNNPTVNVNGNNTFNDMTITSIGTAGPFIYLNNNNTYNNLIMAGVGTRIFIGANQTQTVKDALALGSGGFPVFLQSNSQGTQGIISKPTGSVCMDYIWLRDIRATGGATFNAGATSVNLGNNTNWTFTSCAGYYWVGGTGNWSDYAHHWAYSSGGSILHNTAPTQFDDVFFDANSFTTAGEVITIDDADPKMHNLSFASALYTPTLNGNISATQMSVYGSLKLITNMNQNFTGEWNFMAPNDSNDINTAGKTLQRVNFKGGNNGQGGWVLQNNLTVTDSINLNNGRFRLNGKEVTTKYFNTATSNTRILDLGSSIINIMDGEWNPSNLTDLTFIKGTSEIILKGTSNSNFYGNGLTYNKVTFRPTTTMNSVLTGANTFARLRFEGGVNASLEPVIQNATQFEFVGSCAKQIGIQSTSLGNQSSFRQTSGTVAASFLNVKDNVTTGGATFNANQSHDLGNNAGWSFTSAPTITISANSGLVNCSANNDGWAKVSVIQGTSPFTYLWSTNETTDSISHLIPGIYTVTVRDSNGCAATDAISVVNLPSALSPVNWNASAFDVCQGTSINFTPNEVSTAMHFDGSNDYINMPHIGALNTSNLTVEAWIKADATQSDYATVVDNGSDTIAGKGWSLQFNGSTGNVRFWNANGTVVSSTNLKDNQWHHLAGTYDGSNFKLYVDGNEENAISSGSGIVNSSDDLYIGNASQGGANFKGLIDEIRIWNSARTPSQIQANRNLDLVGNESGLVAYYNMEYNVGTTTLRDLTTNANHGTLNNMDSTADWVNPGAVNSTITYVWNFGDFTTSVLKTPTKSYSTAGTYTVSLGTYDKNGCPNFVTKTVRVSQVAFTVVKTNILCRGNDNGTISVTATGGISPFTYSINNGGTYGSSPSFTGLGAATYSVIAKDSIGCAAAAQNFVVGQPASALAFSVAQNSPICLSTTDGTITVTATGGSSPYQYSKNAGIAYQSSNAFSLLTAGTYTLRVRDANNCVAADQVITITEVDSTKPVFTSCPSNITANAGSNCNAVVTYSLPTATDNCKTPSVILTDGLASGSTFPKGITTVSYLANDSNGNTRTCTFTVNVVDVTAPTVIKVNSSAQLNSSGTVTISPSLINNGSFDNCGIDSIKVYPSTFTCANKGNNSVTLWVRDSSGNIATQTATVNIQDLIVPQLTCKIDTAVLDINGNVSITSADVVTTSSDNCGVPTLSLSKSSFTSADIGSNSILVTSTDASNNITTCSTTVVVIEPSPNAICRNATIYLNIAGNATITPSDLDNGSNSSIGISNRTLSKSSFDCSNIGANTDTLTVFNSFGRTAYCIATVTVFDTIKPTVITQNINVYLNTNGTASILPADVNNGSNDACGILSYGVSPNTFTCENRGNNTVYLTITDVNGNVNVGAATVTLIDTLKPTIITQNITVNLDTLGTVTITPAQVNNGSFDNCTIENLSLSKTTFNCSNVGANTVFLTATDSSGNSLTDSAIVTVVAPNGLPNFTTSKLSYNGVDLTCFGTSDGEITITAASGTSPYTYSKDNGTNYQASNVFGGLPENSYLIKVKDNIGCVSSVSTVSINQTTPLSGTASTNSPVCALTQLDLNATILGGTGARTYSWTGPNNYVSDTTNLAARTVSNAALLNMNGIYSVKVTDANNCVYVPSINVVVNPIPLATIIGANSVCKNAPSPFVTLIGSNGTAPYTFIYSINNEFDTVTTVSGDSIDVAVSTNVAGTFIYKLLSVRDSSSTTCLGLASDSVIMVIRPKPLFNSTAAPIANTICEGKSTTISCTNATINYGNPNYVVAESNNFNNAVGSNWSFSTVNPVHLPSIQVFNGETVLGYLGNQQATYNLTGIPNHDSIKVDFDLYIHDTWDGNNNNTGPDSWKMTVNGNTVINTTFSNISWNTQAYPNNIPAINPYYTGALTNTLPAACNFGGGSPTAKYHISMMVPHSSNALSVVLEAINLENLCNESWSIDNFEVQYRYIALSSNFVWNNPVSSNNSITVSPIVNTHYVATLGTCSDSIEIIVNPTPRADFTINTVNQCLAGNSFDFTNNTTLAGGGAMTYVWTMAGANTTTDTSTHVLGNTYSANGSHQVNLVATSVIGNCTDSRGSKTKTTSVNPPAIITSSVPNPICAGTTVRLTANQFLGNSNGIIYSANENNNFETTIGNNWTFFANASNNLPSLTNFNGGKVLGYLTNQRIEFNQTGLSSHQTVKVEFDLYIQGSWDGNTTFFGPETWNMDVNGTNIINTTFSNNWARQSYPGNIPADNAQYTGAEATGLPNFTTKYHISKTINHTSSNLTIGLEALGLEEITNENWFIDNFVVQVGAAGVFQNLVGVCDTLNGASILWNGGAVTGTNNCYVDVVPNDTTHYNVSIGGCASANYTINVSPTPSPSFTLSNGACSKSVNFNNTNIEAGATYNWSFGDTSADYIGNIAPDHVYKSGTYTVTLSANFGPGCTRTATQTISIGDLPTASFTAATGVGCGNNVQFTSTSTIPSGNVPTYLWSFGETPTPSTSTSQNPLQSYSSTGSYNVSLTVTTAAGCSSTTSTDVNVIGSLVGNTAAFTTTVSGACGNFVETTNTSSGTGNTYLWNFGDGNTSNAISPVHYYTDGGLKTITLTITNTGGCGGLVSHDVTVSANSGTNARVGASIAVNTSSQVLLGNSFDFSPTFTFVNNDIYTGESPSWTFGDGTTSTNTFVYQKHYVVAGNYTVRVLQKTGRTGCFGEASTIVTVLPNPLLQGQNLSNNPNQQVGDKKASASTGVNNIAKKLNNEVRLYPNPNKGTFKVQVSNLNITNGSLKVIDMLGREVYQSTYSVQSNNDVIEFNGLDLSSGTYHLVLSDKGETKVRIPFVIVAE